MKSIGQNFKKKFSKQFQFNGMTLVLDCRGNGYKSANSKRRHLELGAKVFSIGVKL